MRWIGLADDRRAVSSETEESNTLTVAIYSDALLDSHDGVGGFRHSMMIKFARFLLVCYLFF